VKIKVEYFTILRNVTGINSEDLDVADDSSIQDILDVVVGKYGDPIERILLSGKDYTGLKVLFLIDGQNCDALEGLQTKLADGSVLSIVPPLSGG